jgi:hypothetical protein
MNNLLVSFSSIPTSTIVYSRAWGNKAYFSYIFFQFWRGLNWLDSHSSKSSNVTNM